MPILHVSYEFTRLQEGLIDGFANGIVAKLYGNAAYPSPPITKTALVAGVKAYTDALAATTDGSPSSTAAKNQALEALIAQLRTLAAYVDENHGNVLAVLLSSGFRAASTNHAQSPLAQATIGRIEFAGSGKLLLEALPIKNVKSWEAQWKPALAPDSAYVHADNVGARRKMTIINLPRLTDVTVRMRAVGGSTGYGEWSNGVTHAVT
jgi:hypothetical protein